MSSDEGSTTVSKQSEDEVAAPPRTGAESRSEPGADRDTRSEPAGGGNAKSGSRTRPRRAFKIPGREVNALAGAVVFLLLGFAGIYVVAKVADVKNGTVLAAVLIIPALLYLLLSGRVSDLKGPGGLELTLAKVANQTIPMPGHEQGTQELSFEQIAPIAKGRTETLDDRIKHIPPDAPVVLTFTLGSDIDGPAAANYARRLTQFPRFKYVAIVDSQGKLVSYMDERAFEHTIETGGLSGIRLLNNIKAQDVGEVKAFPGMIPYTLTPRTSIADALRKMERTRLNALLVTDEGAIAGIVERDRLANALLLSLIDRVSANASAG
jgi:CBS domain-containing protein